MQMEIEFTASDELRKALGSLGRSEDLKFSPSSRRLAIPGFSTNRLLVIDVEIDVAASGKQVALTGFMDISSPNLRKPHGVSFIDDDTLIVANREGAATIFRLPAEGMKNASFYMPALQRVLGDQFLRLHSPGSVAVTALGNGLYEALICNNYVHQVTRHILDGKANFAATRSEVLLNRGLSIPDGVAVNGDGRWIAISNHSEHAVYLYEKTPRLNRQSTPDGILRNVLYPHGLRFTPDDSFILVADAGVPFVHVYARNGGSWKGMRNPVGSLRVMDKGTYLKGRYNTQEGGPKGIDIDKGMNVLATTCEHQILAFFDLPPMLQALPPPVMVSDATARPA
jgi:DNA-binding beta-propeller fold protein YncE